MQNTHNNRGFSVAELMQGAAARLAALGALPTETVKMPPLVCIRGTVAIRVVEAGGAIWRFCSMLSMTKTGRVLIQATQNSQNEWVRATYDRIKVPGSKRGRHEDAICINPVDGQHTGHAGIPNAARMAVLEFRLCRVGKAETNPDTGRIEASVEPRAWLNGEEWPLPEKFNIDEHGLELLAKAIDGLVSEREEERKLINATADLRLVRPPLAKNSTGRRMRQHHGMPKGLMEEQERPFNEMVAEAREALDEPLDLEAVVCNHGGAPVFEPAPPVPADQGVATAVEELVTAGDIEAVAEEWEGEWSEDGL